MPNWCNNVLDIDGDQKQLKELLKFIEGKGEKGEDIPFSFEKVLATPPELLKVEAPNRDKKLAKKLKKLYGAEDWYDWRNKNWDTKWELDDNVQVNIIGHTACLVFDTAWSPPTNIIRLLAKKFPKLSFTLTYCEPGVGFAGVTKAKGNKLTDNCYDPDHSNPEYQEVAHQFGMADEDEEEDA
jgi:hypothetical protein